MKIKVLVLTTTFPRWRGDSTAGFVFDLSKQLSREGVDVVVLAPHHPGAEFKEEIEGFKVYRFPYFWPDRYEKLCYGGGILSNFRGSILAKIQAPFLLISELVYTLRVIRREEINLIHAHWAIPSGFIATLIGKLHKKPVVLKIYGADLYPFLDKNNMMGVIARWMMEYTINNATVVVGNSTATCNTVRKISGRRDIEVLYDGVDTEIFNLEINGKRVREKYGLDGCYSVFASGRMIERKGFRYLIEAIPYILERLLDTKVVIGGDGPERENLERLVKYMGIGDKVIFPGVIANEDFPKYMKACDVFVLPSIVDCVGDTEGLGLVLVEAMACGTPVVGSRVGGITDIIKDGYNGFLVPEKSPEELADRIIKLLADKKLAEEFSAEGLKTVREGFTWEIIGEKCMSAYEEAVK